MLCDTVTYVHEIFRYVRTNQPVVNDDNSVIAGWCEHAARTLLSFRTCRVVDGGTQCMPLSAAVVNPRSAGRLPGLYSMLGVIGARKPVSRLPRGDCSDQYCGPERALCVGPLRMFEYYTYSISHGQESACGGRVRPHRLAVSVLNNHVRMTHTTSLL